MRIIYSTAFLLIVLFYNSQLCANELIAKSILADIKNKGSYRVCSELYTHNGKWDELLRNVASGKEEWLEVALSLRGGSDAAPSEMLTLAVGEALENNPKNVIRIATKGYQLEMICGGPDVDDARYDSYELSIKAIDKRIENLASIKEKDIINQCNECIRYLMESKKGVASFYQVDK